MADPLLDSQQAHSSIIGRRAWLVPQRDISTESEAVMGTVSFYFPLEEVPKWQVDLDSPDSSSVSSLLLRAEQVVRATKAVMEDEPAVLDLTVPSSNNDKNTLAEENQWQTAGHAWIGRPVKIWKPKYGEYFDGKIIQWLPEGDEEGDYEMFKVFMPEFDAELGYEDYGGPKYDEDGEKDEQCRAVLMRAMKRAAEDKDPELQERQAIKKSKR